MHNCCCSSRAFQWLAEQSRWSHSGCFGELFIDFAFKKTFNAVFIVNQRCERKKAFRGERHLSTRPQVLWFVGIFLTELKSCCSFLLSMFPLQPTVLQSCKPVQRHTEVVKRWLFGQPSSCCFHFPLYIVSCISAQRVLHLMVHLLWWSIWSISSGEWNMILKHGPATADFKTVWMK